MTVTTFTPVRHHEPVVCCTGVLRDMEGTVRTWLADLTLILSMACALAGFLLAR